MTAPENRTVDARLPDEVPEVPTPVETPPPEVLPGGAADDSEASGALAFLTVFRHRNYRLFFSGQLVSLMGTWITNVTQGWLVYHLTGSPLLLGVVSFAGQVPVFFLAPFGGVISDRFDRRRMLVVTQALAMLQSAALATLALTGVIRVEHIVVLALLQGLINAFDVPIRQGMTVDMVGKEDLRHAISLNSMMFNLARVLGPSIAGLLIAAVGAGLCFALDAVSYAAVIANLVQMRFVAKPRPKQDNPLRAVRAGFLYVWYQREIRSSLMLVAMVSAFGASYLSLLPAFARDVLHQGSAGLGFLYGAVGGGALAGAYALARVRDRHLFLTPVAAALCFGVTLIFFSRSHIYWLSLALIAPTAFSLMLLGGSTNTIIQLLARDDMRGRVVAFYAMSFMGMMPWGSLILGWVAERVGTSWAVTVGGCICVAAAVGAFHERKGGNWKLKTAE
ncbi:MAG TPA: MFS transporter [Rhizomicrobium sp.]|jgi:MFS family permease|nr:MFS transporter [Rhizomicrobium sp.]